MFELVSNGEYYDSIFTMNGVNLTKVCVCVYVCGAFVEHVFSLRATCN